MLITSGGVDSRLLRHSELEGVCMCIDECIDLYVL